MESHSARNYNRYIPHRVALTEPHLKQLSIDCAKTPLQAPGKFLRSSESSVILVGPNAEEARYMQERSASL